MDEELELIKDKIKFLEEQLASLKQRVSNYENKKGILAQKAKCEASNVVTTEHKIEESSKVLDINKDIKKDFNNEQEYINYFMKIEKGEEKTALRHFEQLKAWKKRLTDDMNLVIKDELYHIDDPLVFNKLVLLFESNDEMKHKNSDKHHYYYSAAYNAFNRFLHWKHSNVEDVEENILNGKLENDINIEDDNHAPSVSKNVEILEKKYGKLVKVDRNCFKSLDGKIGFVIVNSKVYPEKDRNAYWYAYRERKFSQISSCVNRYLCLGFGNPIQMYLIPEKDMNELKDRLRPTVYNDGTISHYHMDLFEKNGVLTIRVSFPKVEQLELTKYKFLP